MSVKISVVLGIAPFRWWPPTSGHHEYHAFKNLCSGEKVARDKKNAGLNRLFGRDINFSTLFLKSSRPFRTLSVFLINSTEKRLMIKKIGEIETHQTLYFIVFYPNYYGHNVSFQKSFFIKLHKKACGYHFLKTRSVQTAIIFKI